MSNKRRLRNRGLGVFIIFLVMSLDANLLFAGELQEKEANWIEDIERTFPRAEKCKQCHEAQYSQWKGSRLESSLTEPIFKVMLGIWLKTDPKDETKTLCLSCHIPSIKSFPQYTGKVINQILSDNVQLEGVGCSGCHRIQSSSDIKRPPVDIEYKLGDVYLGSYDNAEENMAHRSELAGIYSSSDYCAMCHYDKLRQVSLGSGEMVTKGIECQRCHMVSSVGMSAKAGPIKSIADHSFTGGLPSEFSGKSRANIMNEWLYKLEAEAERRGDDLHVSVNIKAGEIAHTLPEGDPLFKEFILTISVKDQDGREVYKGEKIYTSKFGDTLKDYKTSMENLLRNGEIRKTSFSFKVPDVAKHFDIDLLLTYSLISQPDPDLVDRYLDSLLPDEREGVKKIISEYRRSYTLSHLFKTY